MTPLSTSDQSASLYSVEETDCHILLSFQMNAIHDKQLNLAGTDEMVWATNNEDSYVGYDGSVNRGHFTIDWQGGTVTFPGHDGHDHGEHSHGDDDDHHSSGVHAVSLGCACLAIVSVTILYLSNI